MLGLIPSASESRKARIGAWVLTAIITVPLIFIGVLPKLLGQEPSPELFAKIGGGEPMRYAVGVMELIVVVLLLIPRTQVLGALGAAGSMLGAIAAHLFTPLGVIPELTIDGEVTRQPIIFVAIGILAIAFAIAALRRSEIPVIGDRLVAGTSQAGTASDARSADAAVAGATSR